MSSTPAKTPKPIIDKINGAIVTALADSHVRRRYIELGQEMPPASQLTPDALRAGYPSFANLRLVKSDTDGYDVALVPAIAEAWGGAHPVLFFEYTHDLTRLRLAACWSGGYLLHSDRRFHNRAPAIAKSA